MGTRPGRDGEPRRPKYRPGHSRAWWGGRLALREGDRAELVRLLRIDPQGPHAAAAIDAAERAFGSFSGAIEALDKAPNSRQVANTLRRLLCLEESSRGNRTAALRLRDSTLLREALENLDDSTRSAIAGDFLHVGGSLYTSWPRDFWSAVRLALERTQTMTSRGAPRARARDFLILKLHFAWREYYKPRQRESRKTMAKARCDFVVAAVKAASRPPSADIKLPVTRKALLELLAAIPLDSRG